MASNKSTKRPERLAGAVNFINEAGENLDYITSADSVSQGVGRAIGKSAGTMVKYAPGVIKAGLWDYNPVVQTAKGVGEGLWDVAADAAYESELPADDNAEQHLAAGREANARAKRNFLERQNDKTIYADQVASGVSKNRAKIKNHNQALQMFKDRAKANESLNFTDKIAARRRAGLSARPGDGTIPQEITVDIGGLDDEINAKERAAEVKSVDQKKLADALNARANRLAKDAQDLGYKNVTRESVLASLQKRFRGQDGDPSHDDMMSMMSTMRNDMHRNAYKKFWAERDAAQEKADRQASSRAARAWQTLDKGLSAPGSAMSEAQLEAQARWKARREADRANYHKGAANNQYQGYVTGPQYGQDVYTGMQKQWGPNARTNLTAGGAAYNYAQNLDRNRQHHEAQMRSMDANVKLIQELQGVAKGLIPLVQKTKVGGTADQATTDTIRETPMAPADKKPTV